MNRRKGELLMSQYDLQKGFQIFCYSISLAKIGGELYI